MKVYELRYPIQFEQWQPENCVLVLGFFDGVHRGHQHVILEAKKIANEKGLKLALMSFNQHPSFVFSKHPEYRYLTDKELKITLLKQLGVDIFYIMTFNSQFAALTPEQFEMDIIAKLNAQVVVAGFDYCYGCQAKGSIQDMATKSLPYNVVVVEPFLYQEQKMSSTRIKNALEQHDLETVTAGLGRFYCISGVVVHGNARGRTIGFPTANIKPPIHTYLPGEGVYAVRIQVANQWYDGMASIGRNITFEPNRPVTIEVNIFNFDEQIYGETVFVEWIKYLRPEYQFDSINSLIEQLHKDKIESIKAISHLNTK